jgi:type IV pilus assembly protein PilQ
MNRHSPLFRVAFVSLLLALSLPGLVYVAAQVRHRQLQSTANPRWARFKEVNGSRTDETAVPPVRQAVDTKTASDEARTADSTRIPVRPLSLSTGSAETNNSGNRTEAPPAVSEFRHDSPSAIPEARQTPSQKTNQKSTQLWHSPSQVFASKEPAEFPSPHPEANAKADVNAPVPFPDDMASLEPPPPSARPRTTLKPRIEFHALDETDTATNSATNRLEARLAGMQRRLDQLAQVQVDKQVSDLDRALNLLQQAQQAQQTQQLQQSQQTQQNQTPQQFPPGSNPRPFDAPGATAPYSTPAPDAADASSPGGRSAPRTGRATGTVSNGGGNSGSGGSGREPSIKIVQGDLGEHDERFSIQVQEANLTEVLEMLGQLAGLNILSSREVTGRVSLNLQDVTVDRALDAILKSQGFIHERDGDFVYVRSAAEDSALKQANRKLITKVYQLHYISANEVQKLIDPVLSKGVGRHAVTSPPQVGIAPMPTNGGGDGLSQRDTLLVQDYPEVIAEVDKVIVELDVPPLQVMIEAKILSVALSDSMSFGVNFAMLNGAQNSQLLSGNGSVLSGTVGFPATPALVPAAGDFVANSAGLKYGFIQGDVSGFIKALESIADTTLVAAPQLRVLNKQKAEMIIGERLSYKTLAFNGTQTVENVQFLDAGVKLIFRPFISPDGLVRLEVHPERSKATINEQTGLPNSETTEVTTNVMVRDGTTVVLGGLISEESTESIDRVPFLGAIPLVGAAFRNRTERLQRNELIVLITPRIVTEPEAAIEGEKLQFETQERAAYFRDNLSAVNRTSLTRAHYDRALVYFEHGNLLKAKQQIDAALLQNKGDLECQRLRLKIDHALRDQQARAWRWPLGGSRTAPR